MRTTTTAVILGVLAPWAILATGCHDPRADRAAHVRFQRIARYRQAFIAREHEGPRRLSVMSDLIARERQWHRAHLDRDLGRLGDWQRRDVKRWRERQSRYRSDFEEYWAGNPDLAAEIIPRMFY